MLASRLEEALRNPSRPATAAVDEILAEAARCSASDVHFEPVTGGLTVRFRLDGLMNDVAVLPSDVRDRIIGRLKVLAELPTYRMDVPQEGRVPAAAAPGGLDLRVSVFPTIRGEKAVVRFHGRHRGAFDLPALGLPADVLSRLFEVSASPQGMLLLTGPAGSGKTTTNYAVLSEILRRSARTRHVVTVEDPVEFEIDGATQTQVDLDAGLTFKRCIRSLLRQDPDVILIGEIRDPETAAIAVEAGLTGHLVLSTVHSSSAAGVFARLVDMGVDRSMLASVSPLVVNQRLLRTLCPECRAGAARAPGCRTCLGTGYRGRRVVAEIAEPSAELKQAVSSGADSEAMEKIAGGLRLRQRAMELVSTGETDEPEVERVLGSPGTAGGPREK